MTPDIRQIIGKIAEANVHAISSVPQKVQEEPATPTFDSLRTSVVCAHPNSEVVLEFTVRGTGPLTFQWFHTPIHRPRETPMSEAHDQSLKLTVNNLSQAGLYRCRVSNPNCTEGAFGPRFAIKVIPA